MLAMCVAARAQTADDQYVRIYNQIQEADNLANINQPSQALSKYLEAQTTLQRFQRANPDWNPNVVKFRMNYLATKISGLSAKALVAGFQAPPRSARPATNAPAPNEVQNQLNDLREQIRQLQSDRALLEAKLKESLSAQPAAIDPKELAKTQDQLKEMAKENDLLKVTLAQARSNAPAADQKALEQTRQALVEANQRLAAQTEASKNLTVEKQALQTKLDSLIPSTWNSTNVDETRKALD